MAAISKIAKSIAKHIGDFTSKKTPQQKNTENITKGQRTYREGQRKAAGAGVAVGGAAALAMTDKDKKETKETKNKSTSKDTRTNPKDYPVYKKSTPSSSAFKKAFSEAKNKGKKTFTFEGRSYKVEEKEMAKGGVAKKR